MSTAITKAGEAQRQKMLDAMHPITAQVATDGAEKLTRFRNAGVLLMMEFGIQIDSITNNETIEDGDGEITKLADYWGQENTNRLYEWRNTAAAFCKTVDDEGNVVYDKGVVLEMLKQPLNNGNQLEFEHFKHLGRIANAKTRKALLVQVRKNSWSANGLAKQIKGESAETKNTRSGGRKPQKPDTVHQHVQKVHSLGQQVNNYLYETAALTDGSFVDDLFTGTPTNKVDENFVEKLDDVIELLNNLVNTIGSHVDLLIDGRDHMEKVIANTAAAVEADDQEVMLTTNNTPTEFTDAADNLISGTTIAAKVAEAGGSKKKKAVKKRKSPKGPPRN